MRVVTLLALVFLTACRINVPFLPDMGPPATTLATGESASFHFFTNDAVVGSAIGLQAGKDYAVKLSQFSNWSDGEIVNNETGRPLDATGFADSLMPLEGYAVLKRSREHRWFELMLYQDGCKSESLRGISQLEYDAQQNSYRYRASCSGELKIHVNDVWGFYSNNNGFANIQITQLN